MKNSFLYVCYVLGFLLLTSQLSVALENKQLMPSFIFPIELVVFTISGVIFLFKEKMIGGFLSQVLASDRLSTACWILLWLSTLFSVIGFMMANNSPITFSPEMRSNGVYAVIVAVPIAMIILPMCYAVDYFIEIDKAQSIKKGC